MLCPKAWLGSQLLSTQVRDRSKLHTCIPLTWCIKKPLEAVSRNCVVIGSLNRIATRSFSLANRYRESLVGLGAVRVELWDCCINNRLASFRRNTTAGEVWPESIRCLQYPFLNFYKLSLEFKRTAKHRAKPCEKRQHRNGPYVWWHQTSKNHHQASLW